MLSRVQVRLLISNARARQHARRLAVDKDKSDVNNSGYFLKKSIIAFISSVRVPRPRLTARYVSEPAHLSSNIILRF